jgi:hypothetical protein
LPGRKLEIGGMKNIESPLIENAVNVVKLIRVIKTI